VIYAEYIAETFSVRQLVHPSSISEFIDFSFPRLLLR